MVVFIWNTPSDRELSKMPKLYSTENVKLNDKIAQDHYFILSSDWWTFEYSPEERIFYGYAVLSEDTQNSEAGYISFDELKDLKVRVPVRLNGKEGYSMPVEVDRELDFIKRPFGEVWEEYKRAHGLDD